MLSFLITNIFVHSGLVLSCSQMVLAFCFCALRAFGLASVMPRRGSYLLLLVQKKVTQEKDTPFTALRVPCVARHAGRLRNSHVPLRGALLEQVLADFPRHGCATRRCRGAPKGQTILESKCASISSSNLDNSGFCSASILLACRQDAGATRSGLTQKQFIRRVLTLIPIGVTQLVQERLKRWLFLRRDLDADQDAAVVGAVVAVVE